MVSEKKWTLVPEISTSSLNQYPELPRVIAQLLLRRGVTGKQEIDDFLNVDYFDLHDPFLMWGMRDAISRILKAVHNQEKIIIFGDYDADGVSGAMILYQAISKVHSTLTQRSTVPGQSELSRDLLDIYIPDRDKEGYGLNDDSLANMLKHEPQVVITVDCGVTNHSQIEYLQQDKQIDVIVVDHHSVPEEMPVAHSLIVPKQKGDPYPFNELCGAGLAFKTAHALMNDLRFQGYGHVIPVGYEKWFLDFAAIGTIGDMVPLRGENRIIVRYGLYVLLKTKNKGLRALLKYLDIIPEVREKTTTHLEDSVSVYSVGFQIAPRINAAGRIAHANTATELFRASDSRKIDELVTELDNLNQERREMTERVFEEAEDRILDKGPAFDRQKYIFEGDEEWPAGVIGIVAGRLVEKYHKPVLLYQQKGRKMVASARSIKGFHLAEFVQSIPHLLIAGGGHAQAAGLSFQRDDSSRIERAFKKATDRNLSSEMLVPEIEIDSKITIDEITWNTYDLISRLAPYGIGNPTPVFLLEEVSIKELSLVGQDKSHVKMQLTSHKQVGVPVTLPAIGFNLSELTTEIFVNDTVDVVCQLDVNEWNNQRQLQLKIMDMKKSE